MVTLHNTQQQAVRWQPIPQLSYINMNVIGHANRRHLCRHQYRTATCRQPLRCKAVLPHCDSGMSPTGGWLVFKRALCCHKPRVPTQDGNMMHTAAPSEREAVLWQAHGHCGVSPPAVRLPLYAASHKVRIHARHGHTHANALEGAAVVARVAVPAAEHQMFQHIV
jgi:hypothetical protein